jgi:hypothetical protein
VGHFLGKLTGFDVPLDVAVHEVHTGVGRLEAQGHEAAGVDHDRVATEGIRMRRRQVPARVVSFSHTVARDDLKRGAVKMPGMTTGLKDVPSQFFCPTI